MNKLQINNIINKIQMKMFLKENKINQSLKSRSKKFKRKKIIFSQILKVKKILIKIKIKINFKKTVMNNKLI